MTGAIFHLETVKLCKLDKDHALYILLKKNPYFRWFCKHTLSNCAHFKHNNEIKTTTILESWVLLLFGLQVFTTVCSSSDPVGSVSSLCVWRCGHLLVLMLSEEEPSLPWWGEGFMHLVPLSPASLGRGYRVHTLCPHDQGRPWNFLHVVGGPWTFSVAVLDKVQWNRHPKATHRY
jgi:hypothetical protein